MVPPTSAMKDALNLRLRAFLTMNNTRLYRDKRFGFLIVTTTIVASAFFISLQDQTAEAKLTHTVEKTAPLDLSRHDLFLEEANYQSQSSQKLTLQSGDSLGPLLQKNGISPGKAYKITEAFSKVYDPRNVRAGHSFNLYYDGSDLSHITYKPNVERTVFVSRTIDGFAARDINAEFKMDMVSVKSTIQNSLYLDASHLGAPDKVIQQFASIYEYSVDFQRDIQPGDEFELFFEVARDHKGDIIKAGNLMFTSFSPRGKTSEYYLYKDSRKHENYYDIKGKTAKRMLRRTPVNGARLSSTFGKRRHPILGYVKNHKGVDFAAPRGTPILAAGNGTIERASRYGSFGNYIKIRHTDGYKTAYAHLKSYARGIKSGKYVKQDQVIGYVGTTGRSTGPHLHYEVHLHGKAINPRKLRHLSGKQLGQSEKSEFDKRRAEIDRLRSSSPVISGYGTEPVLTAEADP